MKTSRIITYVILAVVVLSLVLTFCLVGSLVDTYNNLVDLKADVDLQFSQIEVNLQRRMDLIPNFVETVKGAAEHEEAVFTAIAEARSKVIATMESGNIADAEDAIANYETALNRCMEVIVEDYPELTAGQHFTALQDELTGTENRIATSRKYYNEAVDRYHRVIDKFPGILVASIMGFEHVESFQASEGSDVAPTFSFD